MITTARRFLSLAALCICVAWLAAPIWPRRTAVGCIEETITDAFAADITDWSFSTTSCDWSLIWNSGTDALRFDGATNGGCDNKNLHAQYGGAELTQSDDQWVKANAEGRSDSDVIGQGLTVRGQDAADFGNRYIFYTQQINNTSGITNWQYLQGETYVAEIDECDVGIDWVVGDDIAIYVEGSGSSTQAAVWRNPTGADQDAWGAPDCCMNIAGTAFLGTTCQNIEPDSDLTNNLDDTGVRSGLRIRTQNAESTDWGDFDDFSTGNECN